jgi:hypothetical protein
MARRKRSLIDWLRPGVSSRFYSLAIFTALAVLPAGLKWILMLRACSIGKAPTGASTAWEHNEVKLVGQMLRCAALEEQSWANDISRAVF